VIGISKVYTLLDRHGEALIVNKPIGMNKKLLLGQRHERRVGPETKERRVIPEMTVVAGGKKSFLCR
jgi:aromatic ring-cleaving dioxygenase